MAHRFDIEEITPDQYMVRNVRAYPILKGEGVLRGQLFELTTWRRDGLIGRLRMAGLSVATLLDQIDELPNLPPQPSGGPPGWRALTSANERFSEFDRALLCWRPIETSEHNGMPGVVLTPGAALRRRKGRGAADYYITAAERNGGIRLLPANETTALLVGYSNASSAEHPILTVEADDRVLILPAIDLPPPHRELLSRILSTVSREQHVVARARELAERIFTKLGIHLVVRT